MYVRNSSSEGSRAQKRDTTTWIEDTCSTRPHYGLKKTAVLHVQLEIHDEMRVFLFYCKVKHLPPRSCRIM